MKPVEIEFLVRDKTQEGAQRVSASVDRETLKVISKMDRVQAKIDKLRATNADALDQSDNIAEIKKLESQMDKLNAKMLKLAATPSIGPSANEIDAVTKKYNGLNMSIQQIARELPAAAMGPQMFFMAISNNLPIFADELSRARKEYAELTAAGEKGTPVWKQLLSSIFSWQTALSVCIMLLVTYGKEIGDWVKTLFQGKEALDSAKVATMEYNDAMSKGRVNAAKDIAQAETLLKVATDQSKAQDLRREAAEKMQDLYPEYLGNMSTEAIMAGQATEAYEQLRVKLIEVAQSRAAMDRVQELAAAKISPELEAVRKAQEALTAANARAANGTTMMGQGTAGAYGTLTTTGIAEERALKKALETFKERYRVEGETVEEIMQMIEDSEKTLVNSISDVGGVGGGATKKVAKAEIDAQSELLRAMQKTEDARIDLIEDGYERRRALARTEFERQLRDIQANREKLLAADREKNGGAGASDINALFDTQIAIYSQRLTQQLSAIDKEESDAAEKAYDNLLVKYETYQQGRLRIAKQYDQDIAALAGDTQNQARAEEAKEKALEEFDIAFAKQFPQFERWADAIVTKSVEELRRLLMLAEQELNDLESDVNANPEAIAKVKAAYSLLSSATSKPKGEPQEDDSYEKWERLSEALGRVNNDLRDIGETLGGTFGDIIKTAGSISSSTLSMISGIVKLSKTSSEAVEGVADKAGKSMTKLEKASVILSIISDALQVIRALSEVLGGGESSMERNIRLAKEFNEELRLMNERARINQDDGSIFGDAVYKNFQRNIDVMRKALQNLETDKLKIRLTAGLSLMPGDPSQELARAIGQMQVQTQHSTWFRSAKYASLKDLVPELFGDDGQINMDALAKFADDSNETFQKLSDDNKALVRSMVNDWETYEQALTAVRDYLSSIFGELGDNILDSMLAVADGTMSAADAMASRLESLSDVVRQFARNIIYAMTLAPILEKAQADIEAIYTGKGSETEKFESAVARLEQLLTDIAGAQDDVNRWQEVLQQLGKKYGIDMSGTTTQSGKAGAMYTVSQDSFTRLEGIVTSIQAHLASGDLKLDNIFTALSEQLNAMNAIVSNTAPISQIYALLNTIHREGLNVK